MRPERRRRRAAREPSALRLFTFSLVVVSAMGRAETLATGFVADWGAEREQPHLDAAEKRPAALDLYALDDRQRADHRPRQPRLSGRAGEGVGRLRFQLQDLDRARPAQPRIAGVGTNGRYARRPHATAAETVEHPLFVAARLGFDERQVVVAFGVLDRQEAREQAAEREEQHDRDRDQRYPFQSGGADSNVRLGGYARGNGMLGMLDATPTLRPRIPVASRRPRANPWGWRGSARRTAASTPTSAPIAAPTGSRPKPASPIRCTEAARSLSSTPTKKTGAAPTVRRLPLPTSTAAR